MTTPIRTLVVDDSAFVRKVVREMLSGSPAIEVVGLARDGEQALAMVEDLKPDVVTCDLLMPRLDGVEFVRRQMAASPVPIVMLTSSPQDCDRLLEAMDAGAVDVVQKPTALATDDLRSMRTELIDKVRAAANVSREKLLRHFPQGPKPARVKRASRVEVVVIGISTGGPQALRYLLAQFRSDFPVPLLIVMHMPVGYTALFAQNLASLCELEVREAQGREQLRAGTVLLAQAGRHLTLRRMPAGGVLTGLEVEPLDKPHRPSVDVLFRSAADVCGGGVLGVVMTGMGDDGKEGAAWIKAQGGIVLTESEESCVVYGMPRSVVEAGLSDGSYPLTAMAEEISKRV